MITEYIDVLPYETPLDRFKESANSFGAAFYVVLVLAAFATGFVFPWWAATAAALVVPPIVWSAVMALAYSRVVHH